eukprot:6694402-Lingulodinium_polyedra.AAC.1
MDVIMRWFSMLIGEVPIATSAVMSVVSMGPPIQTCHASFSTGTTTSMNLFKTSAAMTLLEPF